MPACRDCGARAHADEPRCRPCAWALLGVAPPAHSGRGWRTAKPVPVADEGGAPFADSVAAAARLLGCTPSNLHQHHLVEAADGYQLVSRPFAPRRRLPVVGPGGRRWDDCADAARQLGVSEHTIRINARRDGDRAYILRRLPGRRGRSQNDPR